jgi:hypothetical protein
MQHLTRPLRKLLHAGMLFWVDYGWHGVCSFTFVIISRGFRLTIGVTGCNSVQEIRRRTSLYLAEHSDKGSKHEFIHPYGP